MGPFARGFWLGIGVDLLTVVALVFWVALNRDSGDTSMSFGQYFWLSLGISVPSLGVVSSVVLIVRGSTRGLGIGLFIALLLLPVMLFLAALSMWESP